MTDKFSMVRPLVTRHLVGSALRYMDTDNDTVPMPHGYIQMFNVMIKKCGFEGPFPEIITRIRPLIDDYPQKRFHGNIDGIEPDGTTADIDADAENDSGDNADANANTNTNLDTNTDADVAAKIDNDDKRWFWVSMVPYRIFEVFCAQHIHDWWYRYNLTRSTVELVSFQPNGNEKEIITMYGVPPETIARIPQWVKSGTEETTGQ